MATLDDVARIALGLPEVTEDDSRGTRSWAVAGKTFAWERPYSKADIKRFGDETPPRQPILAVLRTFDGITRVLPTNRPRRVSTRSSISIAKSSPKTDCLRI